ncbi:MAG: hypothetical protein OCD03_13285 [Hyphomicrobiales bacterium]
MPDTGVAPNKMFVPSDGVRTGNNLHQQQQGAATGVDPVLFDALMNEFATVINNCLRRNGDNKAIADIMMNGFKFIELSNGIDSGDSVNVGQVILRDGSNDASADLPMGGHKHTGLGDGVGDEDGSNMRQLRAVETKIDDKLDDAEIVTDIGYSAEVTANVLDLPGVFRSYGGDSGGWYLSSIKFDYSGNFIGAKERRLRQKKNGVWVNLEHNV